MLNQLPPVTTAMILFYVLGGLTLVSLGLHVWQWCVARRFPLHQLVPISDDPLPPVTLLKPLKGLDPHTESCLRSWLAQDYPGRIEILFGVKEPEDPACALVSQLIQEHPEQDIRLVICPETPGPNPKVCTLMQLEPLIGRSRVAAVEENSIAPESSPDRVVVISDADVMVARGYLSEAVTVLQRENVGLVNSFYRFANPQNHPMWLEAVAVNCDFWSQVCLSNSIRPMTFALGAAMTLRHETLLRIGGFRSLVDYLADDNRLGALVHQTGRRIELTQSVVDCFSSPMNWREVWRHQLRWARTIRACEPWPFFFSILANPLVWSVLWFASATIHGLGWPLFFSMGGLVAYAMIRALTACANGRRLCGERFSIWKTIRLLDQRDGMGFMTWLGAFLGSTIVWRGRSYRVLKGGRLKPIASE